MVELIAGSPAVSRFLQILTSNDAVTWALAYDNCGRRFGHLSHLLTVNMHQREARYVRVELGQSGVLCLSQVEVYTSASVPANELPPVQSAPVAFLIPSYARLLPQPRDVRIIFSRSFANPAKVAALARAHSANLDAMFPRLAPAERETALIDLICRDTETADCAAARRQETAESMHRAADEAKRLAEWRRAQGIADEKEAYKHPRPGGWPPVGSAAAGIRHWLRIRRALAYELYGFVASFWSA